MIKQGWNYCSKSAYREFNGTTNSEVVVKEKKVKEVKVQNKPEKKKIERKSDKKSDKKKGKK